MGPDDGGAMRRRLLRAFAEFRDLQALSDEDMVNVQRCNLLEDGEPGTQTRWPEDGLGFEVRPFEIVTFKLKLK